MTTVFVGAVRKDASEHTLGPTVRAAAEAATDFAWLSKGDSVFIKPALNSGKHYPATTSPVAIREMVMLLKEKGAGRVVVGDMSGIEHVKLTPDGLSGSTRRLMEECGMAEAALEAGAELHFFEEAGWNAFYEEYPASGSSWKRGLMMPAILKEMDHIVLMPRCSRHALAGNTLALKTAVGYWRTDTRLEYHKDAATLKIKTAEANTVPAIGEKQRLVVSAADKVLTTFGPDRGVVTQPEIGLVIASQSAVAHDMVSLAWMLIAREKVAESEFTWFRDPYTSAFVVNMANRMIVWKLGGIVPAFQADSLQRNDLKSIWDDRILSSAHELLGGPPSIVIEPIDDLLPEALKHRLTDMTTLSI